MKEKIISKVLVIIIVMFIPVFITTIMNGITAKENTREEKTEQLKLVRVLVNGIEETIELEEYLIGVVAAEMPANFHEEALKAQAVAARTYTLERLEQDKDFVFSNKDQAYLTQAELENLWGTKNYIARYTKIRDAVRKTNAKVIKYKGELIEAVFHSTSAGKTQAAVNVWGKEIPYLVSVDSVLDINAPGYEYKKTFTHASIVQAIRENDEDFEVFTDNVINEMQIIDRSKEGYVLKIQIGNKIYEGETFREYLDLRSSNFYINEVGEYIEILSKGYGHGVGMSQYGANFLAHEGFNYEEILKHYYTDVEVKVLGY